MARVGITMSTEEIFDTDLGEPKDSTLAAIQRRVLWIAMYMVHHANNVRLSPDGSKVGGHQASSASVVSIMTSLYFDHMRQGDRISIKPHASPTFHAIQYLLGRLDSTYLSELRAFGGLQAYPSRSKDPDLVDFSTGSVGLGPVAPNFAALTEDYLHSRSNFKRGPKRRYISVVGDAELDEGSVWEAIAEPAMASLSNVLWVVDLNRQSLDRIIPGIRVRCWREMFAANGWNVIDAKYGKKLLSAFSEPNGELLRNAIDEMSNDVYQRLLRVSPEMLRQWLPRTSRYPRDLQRFIDRWGDHDLQDLFRNLGGHDFATLRESFSQSDLSETPSVVFAYTLKGWMLPSIGDPQNHSVTLSNHQIEELRRELAIDGDDWSRLDPSSPAGVLCENISAMFRADKNPSNQKEPEVAKFPSDFGRRYSGGLSSQQAYGLVLTDVARNLPELANRIVTVSPDVASSTNLGGWINRVGVWGTDQKELMPDEEGVIRSLDWHESSDGQHIELGISENNLFMMLGQLGLSRELCGELLFPIGTLYDPFVRRGLDAFTYSVYNGAKFIVVGTPSGITLASEGGAHQSVVTPSIGIEMPGLAFYEPCFGQEVEWIILNALADVRARTQSSYLRLSSKRIDQSMLVVPQDKYDKEKLRRQVIEGAYLLVDRRDSRDYKVGVNVVNILASGAMVPEAVEAGKQLEIEGVYANIVNVTGPGPLYSKFQDSLDDSLREGTSVTSPLIGVLSEEDSKSPIVTVADAHPHSLAWIGGTVGSKIIPLGVSDFGQSGNRDDLYRQYGIDVKTIVAAVFNALDL